MIYYDVRDLYNETLSIDMLKILLDINCDIIKEYYFIEHNMDLKNKVTGELKKPHYHIIVGIDIDNRKARKTLEKCFLPYTPFIKSIRSLNGAMRYLTHLDDLDKYQYSINDVNTNDLQKYNDLIVKEYKVSNSDNLLSEYYNYVLDNLSNGITLSNGDILDWFKNKGKLGFYLQKRYSILMMYGDIKDTIYNFGVVNKDVSPNKYKII